MKNIDFIVGGVAKKDDYFFHQEYVNEMWDLLKKNNIILLSPRRTGKTSLMYQLIAKSKYGYKVVHFNVEAITSSADFFISLIDALHEFHPNYLRTVLKGWSLFKNLFSKVEGLEAMSFKVRLKQNANGKINWKTLSEELIKRIASLDDKILFIIDEFPDMLNSILKKDKEEVITFLHHFRKIRQDLKSDNIRWLVSGSVNIRGVLDEINMINTVNDFKTEFLPIIKSEKVDDFISSMLKARKVKFNKSIFKAINDLLGEPMPYFIQFFTQEIYRYWEREKNNISEISDKEIKEVFNKSLLGEPAQDKLQHYYSRIRLYYPEELQEITYEILDTLSKSSSGISEKQLYSQYIKYKQDKENYSQKSTISPHETKKTFKGLMLRLDSDFYTYKNDDNIYVFKIHLIKIWWNKNWAQL